MVVETLNHNGVRGPQPLPGFKGERVVGPNVGDMCDSLPELSSSINHSVVAMPPVSSVADRVAEITAAPIKLNIGGGGWPGDHANAKNPEGWTLVDRSVGKEAYPLTDYADNSVDEVYASHILEHFGHQQTQAIINEWVRVLKPGGRIRIAVPNFEWILDGIASNRVDNYLGYIMGGQTDENDYHKTLFDRAGLTLQMQKAGLVGCDVFKPEFLDCSRLPVSLNMEGFKPTQSNAEAWQRHKISAVMSVPRLGFTDNMYWATRVLPQAKIPLNMCWGAYWGQCMERSIEESIDAGAEWILTLDYDSVFNEIHLQRLVMLVDRYPEIDAIAPIQVKRADNCSLLRTENQVTGEYFGGEIAEVKWAHFGLTLLRASALRKMPKPWFIGVPNEKGQWRDGKTDDDIKFWQTFKEAGNRVFVASRVSIGHAQLMVSWPNENFAPIHQYPDHFREHGQPLQSRH